MMGTINIDTRTLNELSKTVSTLFNKTLSQQESYADKLTMTAPVSTNTVELPFIDDLGDGLREWTRSTKNIEKLSGGKHSISVKSYEKTIGIRREDIEDDNIGLYSPAIASLADNVRTNNEKIIADLLINGETNLCFDGKPFFSNAHPSNSDETFSNILSGELNSDNLASGISTMRKFKGRNGQILNIAPDALIVPPELEKAAWELAYSTVTVDEGSSNKPNFFKGLIKNIFVDARLSNSNNWYLAKSEGVLKPFIKLERQKPRIASLTDIKSELVFLEGEYLFGVEARYVIAYGFWQHIIKFANL
jgi:phage major head subunit gpT-like protein